MNFESDIYELVDQFEDDLAEEYPTHEFYDKAVRVLDEHGYSRLEENIHRVYESSGYEKDEFVECITEFEDDRGASTFLKFVLDDSDEKNFTPFIEMASDLEDETQLEEEHSFTS